MSDLLNVQIYTGLPGPIGPTAAWRTGNGAPSNSLGVDGDNYVNLATGDWYQRASATYSIVGNLKFLPPNGSSFIHLPNGNAYLFDGSSLYYQVKLGNAFGTLLLQTAAVGVTYAALVAAYTQPVPQSGASFIISSTGSAFLQNPADGLYHQLVYTVGAGGVATPALNQTGIAFSSIS